MAETLLSTDSLKSSYESGVTKPESDEFDNDETLSTSKHLTSNGNDLTLDPTDDIFNQNNDEGVLVGSIEVDPELNNEFTQEETSSSNNNNNNNSNNNNTDSNMIRSASANNRNNINLHDVDVHDDSLVVGVSADETGLYDDVMAASSSLNLSSSDFNTDIIAPNSNNSQEDTLNAAHSSMSTSGGGAGNKSYENANYSNQNRTTSQGFTKRVSCYVGNLTWWTSDKDLTDAIAALGVNDLIEIKFYENKVNGQSKGFAMVSTGSDQSFRTIMEKLPKKQLNGQEPIVTHFSRHFFNQFEEQARKDMPAQFGNNNSHDGQYAMSGHNPNLSHHGMGNANGNSHYQHHQQQLSSQYHQNNNFQQQQMMNRSNRNYTPSNGPIATGLPLARPPNMPIGSNGMMTNTQRQSQPSLAGNFPNQQQQQQQQQQSRITPHQQQSIMNPAGLVMPNNNNNPIRPNQNQSNMFNNGQPNSFNNSNNGSLMGNRPPQSGLMPMRPGLSTPLIGNNVPIGQGVGLLNNPRLPNSSNPMQLNANMRSDWDRSNPNNLNFNQQTNQMILMNQNQRAPNMTNPMQQQQQQQAFPFNPACGNGSQVQNSLLPNQPMQQTFQSQQSHYQHPSNFNPQQQSMMHPQMLNNSISAQSHLAQLNPANPNMAPQQQQALIQDGYYHHRPDSNSQSLIPQSHSLIAQQTQQSAASHLKLTEMEFQEAFEKNRIVSSSAITRAVQDASIGQYPSAIETLVTAISLIKQSKISQDDRCKLFISSLQDTKKGIEDKYYSSRSISGTGNSNMMSNNHGSNLRADSRDRDRLKRSRSRDSRDRDRERERERDRERDRDRDRESRSKRGGDKHHRSHRDRSSRERSRDRRNVIVNSGLSGSGGGNSDYYEEPIQSSSSSSSRYHRSARH